MSYFLIHGGRPLVGSLTIGGAKNSSIKLMIASLLSTEPVELNNIAKIADVIVVKKIIEALGGKVKLKNHSVQIDPRPVGRFYVPAALGQASRASSLFLAPLLARFGRAVVPLPGGDKIGRRPLDRHLAGLAALGAEVKLTDKSIQARCRQLQGNRYRFNKPSHTATETMIMAAALARGQTILTNAALEPEVDDLIEFLNQMGAKIQRRPAKKIEITGVRQFWPARFTVMPDRNAAVSFAVAALVTAGALEIKQIRPDHLTVFFAKLKASGAGLAVNRDSLRVFYQWPLQAVNITTRPHPGFMTDWQPLWTVLATQARGVSRIVETIFTNRFQYVPALRTMGAKIEFFKPRPKKPQLYYNFNLSDDSPQNWHGIKVVGPSQLSGGQVMIPDIRAGATLVLAGLASHGVTKLKGAEHLDRGYEDFAGQLTALGAKIDRIN